MLRGAACCLCPWGAPTILTGLQSEGLASRVPLRVCGDQDGNRASAPDLGPPSPEARKARPSAA